MTHVVAALLWTRAVRYRYARRLHVVLVFRVVLHNHRIFEFTHERRRVRQHVSFAIALTATFSHYQATALQLVVIGGRLTLGLVREDMRVIGWVAEHVHFALGMRGMHRRHLLCFTSGHTAAMRRRWVIRFIGMIGRSL